MGPVSSSSWWWLVILSRVPWGLRGFSGLSGGLLPSPSSSLLLPSTSSSCCTISPRLLRPPSQHLASSLTLLPLPDLPVTFSNASWGKRLSEFATGGHSGLNQGVRPFYYNFQISPRTLCTISTDCFAESPVTVSFDHILCTF